MTSYIAVTAEEVTFKGFKGDTIQGYYARPTSAGPFGSVVVIHHMPGWDEWTTEVCRKLAHHGYAAVSPNLNSRYGDVSVEEAVAKLRESGGPRDDQVMGDIEGAVKFLRGQKTSNGKVGVIGFCSGGRQAYLAACMVPGLDAAVDCWGGGVVIDDPKENTPARPVPPLDFTERMACPLLGLFGNEDVRPSPAHVDAKEAALKKFGKTYEFHRYDNAGHAFFAVDRPNYRQAAANDGWKKVYSFFGKYLGGPGI